jgi:hypothetical protein
LWAFTKEGFDRAYELVNHALEWLERAIVWGFSNHRFLSEHSRFLAPLRGDPRFEALLERAREKERAFVV